jgi:muramidase (phage lysozyme)
MTAILGNNIDKYQGVASNRIISAVASAAKKTGVDFSFLMEKAETESNFNPTAKARTSSATGLFQFIEQTWLNMVKEHGDKYGLSEYADKIVMKNGKACVTDCDAKAEILALRKNPEISALMAGEFTASNKEYLESNTKADVGSTEMYLAHFLGAGSAAKFINARDNNGDASAAKLFPDAARANRNVFYERNGKARSLDQVYAFFDRKFDTNNTGGANTPSTKLAANPSSLTAVSGSAQAPAEASLTSLTPPPQALPSYTDTAKTVKASDIIWSDDPRYNQIASGFSRKVQNPVQKLSPVTILAMTQMQETLSETINGKDENTNRGRYTYNS